MSSVFIVLTFLSFLCLIVGLVKPSLVIRWGNKKSRWMVLALYGVLTILCFGLFGASLPEVPESESATTKPKSSTGASMIQARDYLPVDKAGAEQARTDGERTWIYQNLGSQTVGGKQVYVETWKVWVDLPWAKDEVYKNLYQVKENGDIIRVGQVSPKGKITFDSVPRVKLPGKLEVGKTLSVPHNGPLTSKSDFTLLRVESTKIGTSVFPDCAVVQVIDYLDAKNPSFKEQAYYARGVGLVKADVWQAQNGQFGGDPASEWVCSVPQKKQEPGQVKLPEMKVDGQYIVDKFVSAGFTKTFKAKTATADQITTLELKKPLTSILISGDLGAPKQILCMFGYDKNNEGANDVSSVAVVGLLKMLFGDQASPVFDWIVKEAVESAAKSDMQNPLGPIASKIFLDKRVSTWGGAAKEGAAFFFTVEDAKVKE